MNRYLYINVHTSIIHNSQKVKATQMSIDRWMDFLKCDNTYNGILFNFKKKLISNTYFNVINLENTVLSEISQLQKDE